MLSHLKNLLPDISFVSVYTLVEVYDKNMFLLYTDLKNMLDKKFGDKPVEFLPNERIIFLHTDLDFFLTENTPGFTLYNLQLILRELNIPNYFCVVISNIPNYKKYTAMVQNMLTIDDVSIAPVSSLYFSICQPYFREVVDKNFETIERPFIVLSRQARPHRTYFMSKIFDRELQNYGFISYSNISYSDISSEPNTINNLNYSDRVYFRVLSCSPYNNNNDNGILLKNVANQQSFLKFDLSVKQYKNFEEDININDKSIAIQYDNSPIKRGLLYVALETTTVYPEVFLSPISFKGIVKKRPFVILGVPGTIKYLQQLGFKTFNAFWDESYDQIDDFELRVEAILNIIDSISKLSSAKLEKLADSMEDILEYNFNHFYTNFTESEKENLMQGISRR